MKSILLVSDKQNVDKRPSPSPAPDGAKPLADTDAILPLYQRIHRAGYQVKTTTPACVKKDLNGMDAIVWIVPFNRLMDCQKQVSVRRKIPQLWHCDGSAPDKRGMEPLEHLDGILYDKMDENQLRWALQYSILHHQHRDGYHHLKRKLEERKWIDQAKWILLDAKQLSEGEAYQMIRKQAMDERKSMVAISREIIKVHRLLHRTRPRGDL
ncbi:ANTAR domain-containing response regulator [Desmospora activa]|nr:ANTAR domain-containing protein [Desmospora activa]